MPACTHCGASVPANAMHCLRCGVTLSGREQATLPGQGFSAGPPASDQMIGRSIIGQFVVRRMLGQGGMGAVYLADQPEIGRTVVIKVIHPWLSKDPGIAERFAVEARAAARLHGPHIVDIYNYGRLPDGTLFLAMEHLEGITLADALKQHGRMDPTRAIAITRQVCEALTEAHRRGVVHRDLKPSNIMLLERGQGPGFAKVLDFGVARLDGRDFVGKALVGTPTYMAPEQLRGEPVDGRSDIYSLAVVLYEMLTGRPPYVASSAEKMRELHARGQPTPPSQVARGVWVPPAIEACVMRALGSSPHTRPQAADTFADELYGAMMATVDNSHIPAPVPRAPLPPRYAVIGAVIGGMLLLTGALAGGWLYVRGHRSATAAATVPDDDAIAQRSAPPRRADPPSPPKVAPSEAKRRLLDWSVPRLETEALRVATLRGLSPATVDSAMARSRQIEHGAEDGDTPRREVLADLILGLTARAPQSDPTQRDQGELEAVFLSMDGDLPLRERTRILNELKNAAGDDPGSQQRVRTKIVEWIDQHGGAYLRPIDDEIQIEDEVP
jgi:serine/threonine-protein kinase